MNRQEASRYFLFEFFVGNLSMYLSRAQFLAHRAQNGNDVWKCL